MGVQIIQNHPDHRDIGIGLIHQPAHLMPEVLGGAPLGNRHVPPAGQGLAGHGQIPGSLPPVLVVLTPRLSRLHGYGRTGAGQHLSGCLVAADHRLLGFVGFGVQVQDVLHAGHEVRAHLGNAPFFFCDGLREFFQVRAHRLVGSGLDH